MAATAAAAAGELSKNNKSPHHIVGGDLIKE